MEVNGYARTLGHDVPHGSACQMTMVGCQARPCTSRARRPEPSVAQCVPSPGQACPSKCDAHNPKRVHRCSATATKCKVRRLRGLLQCGENMYISPLPALPGNAKECITAAPLKTILALSTGTGDVHFNWRPTQSIHWHALPDTAPAVVPARPLPPSLPAVARQAELAEGVGVGALEEVAEGVAAHGWVGVRAGAPQHAVAAVQEVGGVLRVQGIR